MQRSTIQFRPAAIAALCAAAMTTSLPGAAPYPKQHVPSHAIGKPAKAAGPNHDTKYEVITLPRPDGVYGTATDINNSRTVAGVYVDAQGGTASSFIWEDGVLTTIQHPGSELTGMGSITDSGILFGSWGSMTAQVAGTYDPRSDTWTPLPPVEYNGTVKPLNLGGQINNSGTAIGQACEGTAFAPVNCVAWLWNGSQYEFLAMPGSPETVPFGINDRGQVVGLFLVAPPFGYKGFLYERGTYTELLAGTDSVAYELNNRGQISMQVEVSAGELFKPALYYRGTVSLLPLAEGSIQTGYFGMNERGDLAGQAFTDFASSYPVIALRTR